MTPPFTYALRSLYEVPYEEIRRASGSMDEVLDKGPSEPPPEF